MDGMNLWSPGQETIVFATLLIYPYDLSVILSGIYVVPLTRTLDAQRVPGLNNLKVKRSFVCILERWQVSHSPSTWVSYFSK